MTKGVDERIAESVLRCGLTERMETDRIIKRYMRENEWEVVEEEDWI